MEAPKVTVIISTYNQPDWLRKVLYGYEVQAAKDFEVIVADDGSDKVTQNLIEQFKGRSKLSLTHVWHEDKGFRKTIILNKAIISSKSDYIIFSDGDCIPRNDFIETHISKREVGFFLSGGYFKLPMAISKSITRDDIESQNCFDIKWLRRHGLSSSFKNNKITSSGLKERLLNSLTPTTATWNGHNSSGFKKDIIKVNGFDERMQYGGEDREMGERLFNLGLKAKQIRYSAICIHLDHERGYVKPEMIVKNNKIRDTTKSQNTIKTPYGIIKI